MMLLEQLIWDLLLCLVLIGYHRFQKKRLENIEHGHIACLIYKFLNAARGCDDLSFDFDRSRNL